MLSRSFLAATLAAVLAVAGCGSKAPEPVEPAPTDPTADQPTPVEPAPVEPAPADPVAAEPPPPVEPVPDPSAELLAAETAAWDKAKPVLDKFCAGCHVAGNKKATKKKLDHFDMTAYPPKGHHDEPITEEIREVLGATGKKPTMPYGKGGAVKGDDLAVILAWADAYDAADKGGAHAPAEPAPAP